MGMVFGKVDVAEPAYKVLLSRTAPSANIPYVIRSYGTRFAIEAEYTGEDQTKSPFSALAKYIGVFGSPQNVGETSIAMTAPVVMDTTTHKSRKLSDGGTPISMTAPVIMGKGKEKQNVNIMQFILPAEFDSMSKIPKPTDPGVKVKRLSPAAGAVYRYSGSFNDKNNRIKAMQLAKQLRDDGIAMSEEEVMENYQFWGYNPPFTIPFLRRNEVWISLTKSQVDELMRTFSKE